MYPLLQIKDLSISFKQEEKLTAAVQQISFGIDRGKITAIVGESGSGKSVTALSILQLLPNTAITTGEILFSETGTSQVPLHGTDSGPINLVRGNKISMIFQEPMTSLNPVLTCGRQVMEALMQHSGFNAKTAREKTIELFAKVELPDPAGMIDRYPHQLSGGQKQRVMIAMAMSCNPCLLIADEPTTALDVRVQQHILKLVKSLQLQHNMSVLLITHDLGLVADVADQLIVMYKGGIVEQGNAIDVLRSPKHDYTKALLACRPASTPKGERLATLKDLTGATGTGSSQKNDSTLTKLPGDIILSVKDIVVRFAGKKNIFGKPLSYTTAVNNVSFDVRKHETVGLVGESGCGKTTLGRTILQLIKPDSGKILLDGTDLSTINPAVLRKKRKDLQVVFQDPYGSLNPRISIGQAILEALTVHDLYNSNKQRKEKAISMLEQVQLSPDYFNRYPHQFSGGQRQRICIARALSLNPSFLIFDESVSALDVSVQAGILNLINDLKAAFDLTAIFISHDLSVVHYISDRIMVMQNGSIVEEGLPDDIYYNPASPYTQQLIDAIPGRSLITR